MRPQSIAVAAASIVTGMFLATVAIVLACQHLDTRDPNAPQVARNNNIFAPQIAPRFELQIPEMPPAVAPLGQPLPQQDLPQVRGTVIPTQEYTLSGPHAHGNLAVFLIHGPDTLKDANILTLQEALEQNLAVVHDTGAVLSIDNRGRAPLFIQSGDIVKGGNQDRTLPHDMLIGAQTSRTPINALCVEQGRSFPRGNEVSTSFQTATEQLPGRSLKLAAYRQSQVDVWRNVQTLQSNLARNVGSSVKAPLSQTSLQLSLEHQRVQQTIQDYLTQLAPRVEGKNDVIGFAVVVNGTIQSADVYASSALFQKLWPKLIRASAVGALAERQAGAAFEVPDADAVQSFLAEAELGQAVRLQAGNRSFVIRHETARNLLHDTCDPTQQNVVLHRNFLAK